MLIIFKILITSLIIVLVSEIAKLNDRIGGLIAAMPLTTFLILFWMYYENVSENKITAHISIYTFIFDSNCSYVSNFSLLFKQIWILGNDFY